MKEKLVSVKTYHLAGDDIRIVFSMEDPDEFELEYEDKQGKLKFTGRAIYREEIQLGFMPSVVLKEEAPDSPKITLSLAVPSGKRPENMRSISVKTFAVRTTSRTGISQPVAVAGQNETYEIRILEGTAW